MILEKAKSWILWKSEMEYLRKKHFKKKHEFDVATMKFNIFSKNQIYWDSMIIELSNEV